MELLVQEGPGVYRASGQLTEQDILDAAYKIAVSYFTPGRCIDNPVAAGAALYQLHKDTPYEVFGCLMLDSLHHLIKDIEITKGTIDSACVHSRRVVQEALNVNASRVIFYHNHPTGLATPSELDKSVTSALKQALSLFEILVLDHIVIGRGGNVSFAERGLL